MTICALPLCHPLCSSLLSGVTIFVTGVATAARGENGGQIITAMGREAVGADLIEDGISIVVIDGLAKPIVSTLDPVQYGMNRGIREDIDIKVLREKAAKLDAERAKGWCGWMEGILWD